MATFGESLLESLTTGMYDDSKVIYREYIQNACDQIDKAVKLGILEDNEGSIDIDINTKNRMVTITDNATGIPAARFKRQLEDIANSDKERGIDKGFRGIGRLVGLAYCKTLTFSATSFGEPIRSIMIMDARKMREMFASATKYTVEEILSAITAFDEEEADPEDHGFIVRLSEINEENTDLLNRQAIESYLSFVAPVPYKNTFTLRNKIKEYAENLKFHIDEYRVYLCGNQLFKDYSMRLYNKESSNGSKQQYDELTDIAFHNITRGTEVLAWMWYGLCRFEKAIPKSANPMYGFRVRQGNIQIGDNNALAQYFREERGNSYYVGEVFIVSKELIPNSRRDNFIENPTRVAYQDGIKLYCHETLHNLYNMASKVKGSYKRVSEYTTAVEELDTRRKTGFVSDEERIALEQKVIDANKLKTEAMRIINRIPESKTPPTDPTAIVQQAIKTNFDQKGTVKKAAASEKKQEKILKPTQGQSKLFTDSLTKLDKNKQKLVAQILVIVRKYADEDLLQKIQSDLEKEFK